MRKTKTADVVVVDAAALVEATQDPAAETIVVSGVVVGAPTVALLPGQRLVGTGRESVIRFAGAVDGVRMTTDNTIEGLRLETTPTARSLYNDTSVEGLGTLLVENVTTIGQVQILADDNVRSGHVVVRGLDVVDADATERERLFGYGMLDVPQGAFTLWNRQPDESVKITGEVTGVSVGREGAPVRGSGVFVSGAGSNGPMKALARVKMPDTTYGTLELSLLETGPVFSDGRIPEGRADLITGGVFVLYGATVELVHNLATVTTYGPNDMILDNWGDVTRWVAEEGVVSYGPSAIGFVNFGTIGDLVVRGTTETFGTGARGFNVYLGSIDSAEFDRIVTHGDAAVGLQVSHKIDKLMVRDGIQTSGGTGPSLVKGVIVELDAMALSIQDGAEVGEVVIGDLSSEGEGVTTLDIRGHIEHLTLTGDVVAYGLGASAMHVEGGSFDLDFRPGK
jgi:hypothetical protein